MYQLEDDAFAVNQVINLFPQQVTWQVQARWLAPLRRHLLIKLYDNASNVA